MSAFRDPPRIVDSPDAVPSFLRADLEAERLDSGPDSAHIERLAQKLEAAHGSLASTRATAWSWPRLVTVAGVGLLAIAGVAVVDMRTQETGPALVATSAPSPISPHPVAIDEKRADDPPAVHPDELPTAVPPANAAPAPAPSNVALARRAPRAPVPSAPARPAASESAEIDLLDRAQDALRSRPADTLALCDKHERDFANGRFTQEREALAIEALLYLGRRAEAERRWSEFQQRYPTSNHRSHLADLFSSPR